MCYITLQLQECILHTITTKKCNYYNALQLPNTTVTHFHYPRSADNILLYMYYNHELYIP